MMICRINCTKDLQAVECLFIFQEAASGPVELLLLKAWLDMQEHVGRIAEYSRLCVITCASCGGRSVYNAGKECAHTSTCIVST